MRQQTFASQAGFEKYGKKTRREQFLDEMSMVVPWSELEALVRPHYPKGGNGRLPGGPERDASGGEDWGLPLFVSPLGRD